MTRCAAGSIKRFFCRKLSGLFLCVKAALFFVFAYFGKGPMASSAILKPASKAT